MNILEPTVEKMKCCENCNNQSDCDNFTSLSGYIDFDCEDLNKWEMRYSFRGT